MRQAEQHADAGRREAEMPIDALRQISGDERANERAEVDTHVEQGEPGVAAGVSLPIERADERAYVRLQQAGADDDEAQACVEERQRLEREREVPAATMIRRACADTAGAILRRYRGSQTLPVRPVIDAPPSQPIAAPLGVMYRMRNARIP
jgi:hypothetical protein